MTRAIPEETNETMKDTPKKGCALIGSNNAKPAKNTDLVAVKSFEKALPIVSEIISFPFVDKDGSQKQINHSIKTEKDLNCNPKAGRIDDSGAIANIPEFRRLFSEGKLLHAISGNLMGKQREAWDDFLKSDRKSEMVAYLKWIAENLKNYKPKN